MTDGTKPLKVLLTGATGLVGEGVLLECLQNEAVAKVLSVSRRPCGRTHEKLEELIVPDFLKIEDTADRLAGFDACFYCAGISSRGLTEAEYARITYDTAVHFAEVVARLNPAMTFVHVSGMSTDGTEQGRVMWARVKGRAENAIARLPFARVYNVRPGFMKPFAEQRNVRGYYKAVEALYPLARALFPRHVLTLSEVGRAMIHAAQRGAPKTVLEAPDLKALSA